MDMDFKEDLMDQGKLKQAKIMKNRKLHSRATCFTPPLETWIIKGEMSSNIAHGLFLVQAKYDDENPSSRVYNYEEKVNQENHLHCHCTHQLSLKAKLCWSLTATDIREHWVGTSEDPG